MKKNSIGSVFARLSKVSKSKRDEKKFLSRRLANYPGLGPNAIKDEVKIRSIRDVIAMFLHWCLRVMLAVKDFWLEFFEHVFAILGEFCLLIKEKVFGFGKQAAYKLKSKYKKDGERPKNYRQDIKRRMRHDMQRERE